MTQPRMGGSFAPPLSDELLAKYKAMCGALPDESPVRDAMAKLLRCCGVWWELPEPNGTASRPHQSGVGTVVDMHDDHKKALWDHIPWSHRSLPKNDKGEPVKGELDHIQELFDTIDPASAKDLRDAVHHLLWHVVELDLDREPLTKDRL